MRRIAKWEKVQEAKLFIELQNNNELTNKNFWNSDDEWVQIFEENNLALALELSEKEQ